MNTITKIRVGTHTIGITGLKTALSETAEALNGAPDDAAGGLMLAKLKKRNYIAASAAPSYEEAFHRAYLQHIGAPMPAPAHQGIHIRILGPGCPRCERLEREMASVLAETGIQAELDHVRDLNEIADTGVMGTPALIINNEVKAVGTVPPKSKLTAWLKQAAGHAGA